MELGELFKADLETMQLLVEPICSINLQTRKSIQHSRVVLIVRLTILRPSLRSLNQVRQGLLLAFQDARVIILKMIKFQLLFRRIIVEFVRAIVI